MADKVAAAKIPAEIGVLITCDPPMKQFILYLSQEKKEGVPFVIADLDATHLLINVDFVDKVKARIAQYVEEQNTDLDIKKRKKNS